MVVIGDILANYPAGFRVFLLELRPLIVLVAVLRAGQELVLVNFALLLNLRTIGVVVLTERFPS